jgi:hypothetical protein
MNLRRISSQLLFVSCLAPFAAGCEDDASPTNTTDTAVDTGGEDAQPEADTAGPGDIGADTGAADSATDTADTSAPDTAATCDFEEPPCSDQQISALDFSDEASGGPITEEGTVAGEFLTHIDATAGGFQGTLGYTYAAFTDEGLVTLPLSDEASLESMDWDIAFRRFVIRLNSGVSGPSCVLGGRTAAATTWDGLTAMPANVNLREEQYFIGDACEYVPETSGIGSPQTILSSYWSYGGCVAMTGNIYVVQLRDGRRVKVRVESYYNPDAQAKCDETDSAPTPNGSGNIRMRWAFID